MEAIVHKMEPVTLVGGAPCHDNEIRRAVEIAPIVAAADGGAVRALEYGLRPEAVIGDLDSIPAKFRMALPSKCFHRIPEQNSTDFDKALRNIDAPLVIGVGFSGGRVDHQLAVFNGLVRHATRRCVLVGSRELVFLAPPEMVLELAVGTVVSLFPMGAVSGVSRGLRWEIEGIDFAPDARIGTSNEVVGPLTLRFDAPKMLVILPVGVLGQVCAMLARSFSKWPVL